MLDWKSGHVINHIEGASENYQLRLYAGVLVGGGHGSESFGHIVHLRHGAVPEVSGWVDPDTAPVPWGPEVFEWAVGTINHVYATLAGREPTQGDAVWGGHCVRCDDRSTCENYAQHQAQETALDATPEWLLSQGKVLEARGKELLGILREKMESASLGTVTDGFFTATIKETTKRSEWKSSAFTALREMLSEDELARVCQPTKMRLESLFKKKKVADMLDAFCAEHLDVTLGTELQVKVEKRQRPEEPKGESSNSGTSSKAAASDASSS